MPLRFATLGGLCAFALIASLRAQPVTLLNDVFADGERTTQNLPASAAWYTTNASRGFLSVGNGAMTLVAIDNDRPVWAYFPAVSLRVGESLTLSIDLNFTRAQPNLASPFKVLLASTNGLAPRQADGAAPSGRYQGYGSFINLGDATGGGRVRKRNGPAAANTSATLFELTDGTSAVAWATFGEARTGLAGVLQASTPYTIVLRVTRTATDTASVTTSVRGGALNPANTLTEIDASGIFTSFDTIGIGPLESVQTGDVRITRAELVHDINSTRLTNLSILTTIPASGDAFTMGYVVGGSGTSGPKPLVIRAAGPSLGALGVPGTLDDPRIELFAGTTKTAENDNWGGGVDVRDAMAAVGAFPYANATSRDAASVVTLTTRDNNSVRVSAAGNGTGAVIAEIYDATPPATFVATTPRLVNVSVLKHLGTGLTVGFFISGSGSKTVLVRAIGPTLTTVFGVDGAVQDPQLTLFSGQSAIGTNDNWAGTTALTTAFGQVGAFVLPAASRDAALVAVLAPGGYTVQVSGVGTTTGVALVEVYEVP